MYYKLSKLLEWFFIFWCFLKYIILYFNLNVLHHFDFKEEKNPILPPNVAGNIYCSSLKVQ